MTISAEEAGKLAAKIKAGMLAAERHAHRASARLAEVHQLLTEAHNAALDMLGGDFEVQSGGTDKPPPPPE